jgi:CDP-diacylglycerol--glycerol-3-phosphate 3-phosphatidyltransferase
VTDQISSPETVSSSATAERKAPIDEMTFGTTPNILTLIRIVMVPVVVLALYQRTPEWDLAAALIFGAASITDYFDGYLARKQQIVTIYGKLMDPLADKFLVICSLVMLQEMGRVHPVVVMILICRELAITGLRALASAEGVIIPASKGAKWKTAIQMFAVPFLMVEQGLWGIPLFEIGMVLMYISLAFSLWSAKDYGVDFFRAARESRKKRQREKDLVKKARRESRLARILARSQKSSPSATPTPPSSDSR